MRVPLSWRAGSLAALALLAVVVFSPAGESSAVDAGPRAVGSAPAERRAPSPAQDEQALREELARKHAPIVYLRQESTPCGTTGNVYAPVEVDILFGENDRNILRTDSADPGKQGIEASDLFEAGEDYYIDYPGAPKQPGCTYDRDFQALRQDADYVAYAHIAQEDGYDGIALQYWLYYYFNDWSNNHEGDWESIQLRWFDANSVEEALASEPDHAAYSQHSRAERAAWDSDTLTREGDRPVIYSAQGAHASMYGPYKYVGRAEGGQGFGCDDAQPPHDRIELEARLLPPIEEIDAPDHPYAWLTYEGRWGERLPGEFNGPTGPNMKTQFTEPFTWEEERLRDGSVTVPTVRTAGIDPSEAFCTIVARVSVAVVRLVRISPLLIPAILVVVGGGAFVAVRRTDFALVNEPLRRRRRAGQILRASWYLYRKNAALLASISLLYVPTGFVASWFTSLLLNHPPIENALTAAGLPDWGEIVAAFAIGATTLTLTGAIVSSAIVAALPDIEAGRPTSAIAAYRTVLAKFWDILRARLRALAIVMLLLVSLVGIPWGIKRAIDWLFIGEEILLDGSTWRDAAPRSAHAVRGQWWRVAIMSTLIIGSGLLLPLVIVTPVFLLATAVPLATISIVSSLIYILLLPFVAISLALLYFDVAAPDDPTS